MYNEIKYYALDNGRFWDIQNAVFVDSIPEGFSAVPCFDENNKSTVEGLIGCLDCYGYPKGELKTDAEYAAEVRAERDKRIAVTDYLMMPDYPLSDEKRQAVSAYRQSLRDIPEQSGFPRQVNWPEKNF